MKQNKEMIEWFNNYFDNCYYVRHNDYPESIFMFYDINYNRQLKLAKLEGKDYVEKTDITGECLFEQEWKNKQFYCNYRLIWGYFRDNYSIIFSDFKSFIKDRLEEYSKLSVNFKISKQEKLMVVKEEHSKLSVLTPKYMSKPAILRLDEHSKMNVIPTNVKREKHLEEHSKLSILTHLVGGNKWKYETK